MNELRNSKSDDQLEELLLLTEQMQEELDQKDRTIRELKVQLDESLTLNEKLNSENKTENIQALKNDLRKTKELLQSEKEKTHTVQAMIEECRDKQRQAEQERDYALSHQKKVEIPVEFRKKGCVGSIYAGCCPAGSFVSDATGCFSTGGGSGCPLCSCRGADSGSRLALRGRKGHYSPKNLN